MRGADLNELAAALFGARGAGQAGATATSTVYATALSDSDGGTVTVDLGGDVTTPDADVVGQDAATVAVELPTTQHVSEGDAVMVTVTDGHPVVTGVVGSGDATEARVSAAQAAADEAQAAADAVSQHFWADGGGCHVSTEDGIAEGERNALWNSEGLLLRSGANNDASLTGGAVAFYDGEGNGAANVTASFGATSATIGREGEQHATVDADGLALYDGDGSRLASLGKSSVTLGEQDQAARIEMCGGVLGITTEDPGVSWNTRKTLIDATGTVYVSGVNNAGIKSTAVQAEQDTGTDVTATAAVDAISRTDGDFVYPQVELTAAETYTGASAGSRDARLNVSAEAVQSQVYSKDSSSSLLKQTTDALTFDGATVGLGQLRLTDANALGATSSHEMQALDAVLSREERKLTKLWSGSVAKGGSITLARPIADYLVVAAVAANTATVLLGTYVPGYSRVTCSAQVDYGSSTGLLKLTFEVTGANTLKFVSGSEHAITSGISGAARTPAAFYGII